MYFAGRATTFTAALLLGAFVIQPILPGSAQSGPPPRPFESLSDTWRARSTYIVDLDDSILPSQIPAHAQALANAAGGQVQHVYTHVLGGFAVTMSSTALLKMVGSTDKIISVQRDSVDWAFGKPDCSVDSSHPSCKEDNGDGGGTGTGGGDGTNVCGGNLGANEVPWGVKRVGADHAWTSGCGADVDVFILDSGIDVDHPDLQPIGNRSADCLGGSGVCTLGAADDKNGHGTHVAGTVGARVNTIGVAGVAPRANLHSVKVLKNGGLGFRSDILAGINYVAGYAKNTALGPVVANMSIGGSGSKSSSENCGAGVSTAGWTDSYHKSLCEAAKAGVVFVVAAGNEGQNTSNVVPAAYYDAVITVSATDDADKWPSWSNYGTAVAVAAPGVDIFSTTKDGQIGPMSGTSMASPHVAGAVALYLQGETFHDEIENYSRYTDVFYNAREAVKNTANGILGSPKIHPEGLLDATFQ